MFNILFIDFPLGVAAAAGLFIACAGAADVRQWIGRKLDRSPIAADLADRIHTIRQELGLH